MKTQSSCDEVPKLVHSRNVSARVLIVEDSRTQAEWLAQVLSREGYDVHIAADGREAIKQVRSDPPDLVLLDMILPDMDGLEVLRIVKARSEDQFIPVILLSVKSDLDSRVAGLRIFKALRQKTYPLEFAGESNTVSTIRVTASAGLAFFPSKDITTPELLMKFADEALYRAKREGRDTICLYQAQSYRYDTGAR